MSLSSVFLCDFICIVVFVCGLYHLRQLFLMALSIHFLSLLTVFIGDCICIIVCVLYHLRHFFLMSLLLFFLPFPPFPSSSSFSYPPTLPSPSITRPSPIPSPSHPLTPFPFPHARSRPFSFPSFPPFINTITILSFPFPTPPQAPHPPSHTPIHAHPSPHNNGASKLTFASGLASQWSAIAGDTLLLGSAGPLSSPFYPAPPLRSWSSATGGRGRCGGGVGKGVGEGWKGGGEGWKGKGRKGEEERRKFIVLSFFLLICLVFAFSFFK